jgi:hypothetical protein
MKRDGVCHSMRNSWTVSAAVKDCIRELDEVGAPLHISERAAKKLPKQHGFLARGTDTRREALSYRIRQAATCPDPPPDVPPNPEEHTPTHNGTEREEHLVGCVPLFPHLS